MGNSTLYNLYTEDYSVDSIRKAPVPVQELIREGLDSEIANSYVNLSEKLYDSFLHDIQNGNKESASTLTIWRELLELCVTYNICECDLSEEFPLYNFDVVLRHQGRLYPRDISCFRMTLEEVLSYVDLSERKLEREYNLTFAADPDDEEYLCVVRMNPTTQQLDKLPTTELNSILARIQNRKQKNEAKSNSKAITKQINGVFGDALKIKAILEEHYHIADEQLALDSLAEELQKILNQPPVHNLTRKDLLWVIMGDDTCMDSRHHIMDIRANFEFYNGTTKQCLIRRCANCAQYQIEYAKFEKLWKEYGLPKVEIVYLGAEGDIDGDYWNDLSVFREYGYTVSQERGLTARQRQQLLKRIIDQGIRSKQETIHFLRRRIRFNGRKIENWLARSKWEEDLHYVESL